MISKDWKPLNKNHPNASFIPRLYPYSSYWYMPEELIAAIVQLIDSSCYQLGSLMRVYANQESREWNMSSLLPYMLVHYFVLITHYHKS